MKNINYYFFYIFIVLIFAKKIYSLKEYYNFLNSTKCNESFDGNKLNECCKPLLNLWDTIRSNELYASDILFPVPFYKTESIVSLCRLYTKCKNDCFDDNKYSNSCSSNFIKNYFYSQLEYFCGNYQGIKYWSEMNCLRNILLNSIETKNHEVQFCFNYINYKQKININDKCKNMEYFIRCINKHVKSQCGIHTLKILTNAIKIYGCLKNDKIIFKRVSTNSTKFINKNIGKNLKLTSKKRDNINTCDKIKQNKLVQCYTPLMLRWDQIEKEKFNNSIEERYHFFPMLKNNLHEIGELCDILNIIIEECLTTSVIQDCLTNENLMYVDQELGQSCTYFHKNIFNSDYICMKKVILKKPECYKMIRGRNLPGLNPLIKCKYQTAFYECIHDDIKNTCGEKGLRILDDTIFNYGCKHPKKVLSTTNTIISKDEPLNIDSSNKHLTFNVAYKIDNSFILTKYGDSITKGKNFYYKISNDCTHFNLMKSRSCTSNIIYEWKEKIINIKNPITISIFLFSNEELLNMCDNYANIFLCSGLENILSCMDDGNIRFIRDNLAYPCSPNKISKFMKSFNCIKRIINNNHMNCKKFIVGRSLPGEDQRKCKGIVQFYDCISYDIKKYCGENGKQQLWQYINEYGCL